MIGMAWNPCRPECPRRTVGCQINCKAYYLANIAHQKHRDEILKEYEGRQALYEEKRACVMAHIKKQKHARRRRR